MKLHCYQPEASHSLSHSHRKSSSICLFDSRIFNLESSKTAFVYSLIMVIQISLLNVIRLYFNFVSDLIVFLRDSARENFLKRVKDSGLFF